VLEMAQPLPMARAVLHYRYGVPALASRAWAARLFRVLDRLACRLLPRALWAYVVIRARPAG